MEEPTTRRRKGPAGDGAAPDAAGKGELGDLDQVREILFGAQMTTLEQRVERVEQELRAQMREELTALEHRIKHEVEAITERMNAEERERRSGDAGLLAKLRELGLSLESRIADLGQKTEQGQGALRDQLLSQSNLLSDAIQQRYEESQALVTEGLRDLRDAKADRQTLSSLLMDVAQRLSDGEEPGTPSE